MTTTMARTDPGCRARAAMLVALGLTLGGCGLKGDLYLPEAPPEEAPAETEPAEAEERPDSAGN